MWKGYPNLALLASLAEEHLAKTWNSRSGRLEGKSKDAVETNAKIERILQSVNSAVDNLTKRNVAFTATTVKEMKQQTNRCEKHCIGKDDWI